ncbi:MAG TPA: hypothetical protein DCL73_17220 [Treponema sp.]|nr:hypothetical protein [Treponema sp.]
MTVSEIQHGETDNVEFKLMEPDEDKKFLKTVAAFSNCGGGTVVFGVKNGTREIIGIPEDSVFTVMDGIADSISDNISPQIIPSITFQTINNKTIVVVQVYPGQNTPYYLKSEGVLNGTYIRVGATTRKAENEKVQEFILRGTHQSYDELFQNTEPADRKDIDMLCSMIEKYNGGQDKSVTVENLVSWKLLKKEGGRFIVNAVMHRNYLEHSCIQVSVFDDRIEVLSPGGLYGGLTKKEMLSGSSSIRNRLIADIFQKMHIVEKWGTGIQRVFAVCQEAGIAVPEYTVEAGSVRVNFYRQSFDKKVSDNNDGVSVGANDGVSVGANKQKILDLIQKDAQVTAKSVAEMLGISKRQAERLFSELKRSKKIVHKGSDKSGYWNIIK